MLMFKYQGVGRVRYTEQKLQIHHYETNETNFKSAGFKSSQDKFPVW